MHRDVKAAVSLSHPSPRDTPATTADELARRKVENSEECLRVSPNARRQEAGGGCQGSEIFDRVLVGELGDDFFVVVEIEFASPEMHDLLSVAKEMHFDSRRLLVING